MAEVFVGSAADFNRNDRLIVRDGALEIGVFHRDGEYYAYRNECLHQGGPACEGLVMGKVEDVLAPDRTHLGERFSADETHFVCPWHGYEYDLRTGEFVVDRTRRLQQFAIVKKGEDVYVVV